MPPASLSQNNLIEYNYYEGGQSQAPSGASDADTLYQDDPPQRGGEAYVPPKKRIYFADWTRALAIQLVIFIHCLVNAADASGFDPEESPATQQKKDGIIKCLVQIGIPMFFYISGMGATFFNTEGKGFFLFTWGKILRLLIPFVIAIFVFLIPRLYFGQPYEDWCRPDGEHVETDYWTYNKLILPSIFSKLSWLWYLPALFMDCILTYPLLAWSVRRSRKIPFNGRDDGNIVFLQLAIFVAWCYPAFYLDTSDNYGQRFLLPSILTLAIVMMLFYVLQLAINTENGDKYAMWMKLLGPVGSICLNLWKDQAPNQPLHHVLMMINYDAIFFSQGMLDQLYYKNMMRTRNKVSKTVWAPACITVFIFVYALSCPQNYTQTGFLFFYPLYSDYTIQCLYTTGTWLWLYTICWLMHAFANKKFNERTYNLLTGSSLYAYVSHYFFIILIAVFIIRPYKISFVPALFINIILCNAVILSTYALFAFLWGLIFPKKEETAAPGDEIENQGLLKNQEVMVDVKAKQ